MAVSTRWASRDAHPAGSEPTARWKRTAQAPGEALLPPCRTRDRVGHRPGTTGAAADGREGVGGLHTSEDVGTHVTRNSKGSGPLAEVRCVVGTISSARASDSRANLGRIAMSHISGRAGWWKPPSPVLVRASGEQSPGATRQSELTRDGPNPESFSVQCYIQREASPVSSGPSSSGCSPVMSPVSTLGSYAIPAASAVNAGMRPSAGSTTKEVRADTPFTTSNQCAGVPNKCGRTSPAAVLFLVRDVSARMKFGTCPVIVTDGFCLGSRSRNHAGIRRCAACRTQTTPRLPRPVAGPSPSQNFRSRTRTGRVRCLLHGSCCE